MTLPRCEVIAGTDPQTAISTETLFGSRREILLSHEGTLYRLRITSKDKLILTK
ncbi:MAG: hemin uptake protein HemP [Gammaproteobacteria bacterium]|nr:hemin uptake protein HemP [Gammaproteobacteria bacterium]